jgi:hypothetical protein
MPEQLALQIEWLERQHRGLDAQVSVLMRRAHLTPTEQQRARELKKQRLNTKDRLAALRRLAALPWSHPRP